MQQNQQGASGYSPDYSGALSALRNGKKVCRAGWNGKGTWLVLLSHSMFVILHCEPGATPNPNGGYDYPIGDNGEISHIGLLEEGSENKFYPIGDCLCMKTAQNTFELGWRPTSMDMLAEDWQVLDAE